MKKSVLLGLTGILVLSACAKRLETVKVVEFERDDDDSWVGRPYAELEELWGQPSIQSTGPEGGRVLTYQRSMLVARVGSDHPVNPSGGIEGTEHYVPVHPIEQHYLYVEIARFWLDDDDRIQRQWLSPEVHHKRPDLVRPQEADVWPHAPRGN